MKNAWFSFVFGCYWCTWVHTDDEIALNYAKLSWERVRPLLRYYYIIFGSFWQLGPHLFHLLCVVIFFCFSLYTLRLRNSRKVQWFFTREPCLSALEIVFKHYEFNCAIAWLLNGNGFFLGFFFRVLLCVRGEFFFQKKLVSCTKCDRIEFILDRPELIDKCPFDSWNHTRL